ncbi:MAG: hypothetical protein K6343_03410 [Caldisericaceae bacterium]
MKILGLIEVNKVSISEKEDVNFENILILAYKLSELGAESIVLLDGKKENCMRIKEQLEENLDIPVLTIEEIKGHVVFIEEYLNGSNGETLIIEEEKLLSLFNEKRDNLPQLISLVCYKAKKDGFKAVATTDIESALLAVRIT